MGGPSGPDEAGRSVPVRHINLPQYVQYCERKLDEYEQERRDLLASLDALCSTEQSAQSLRRALRKKEEEVLQLQQKATEDQRAYLEARADADLLYNENQRLRSQELADRQKIAELLRMTCPRSETPPEPWSLQPLPAPTTLHKYSTQLLLDTLAARDRQHHPTGDAGLILSRVESELLVEFWTHYGKQEEEARLEAARQQEQQLTAAEAYFRQRAEGDAQEIARLQAALGASTQALCQYRHHAQISHRELQRELWATCQEMQQQLEGLTQEKEQQARRLRAELEETQHQDQQHIAHLQRMAQEQDAQFYEQLQAVADSKHRMATKVKRVKSQLADLKWRCERLSQFRYYCLKGYESELQLLARHLEQLEKKLYFSLRPTWQGGNDAWVALRAMADSEEVVPPPPPLPPATLPDDGVLAVAPPPFAVQPRPARPKKSRRDAAGRASHRPGPGGAVPAKSKGHEGTARRVTFSPADSMPPSH